MLTVGKLLQSSREKKGISLEQAEKKTRVRKLYLKAVENEDWSVFTSRIYIIGAIKSYSSFLGIDPEKAMAYFRRDYEKKENVKFRKIFPKLSFLPESKKLIAGGLGFVFLFFILYFGYQIYIFLSPPEIYISAPEKRIFRNLAKIEIVGKTQKDSVVTIFNEQIFPDDSGVFHYSFPLKKGNNPILINVKGANGKESNLQDVFILE